MSAYRDAISTERPTSPQQPTIIVNTEKAGDTFWTAVKWIGACVTLVVGYREARTFYEQVRKRSVGHEDEEGSDDE